MMDVFFSSSYIYMYYYDYNDKNTVGKHLFFLCVNLNGLKRVSTGFNEGGGGGGGEEGRRGEGKRVSEEGEKRVGGGRGNAFQQI